MNPVAARTAGRIAAETTRVAVQYKDDDLLKQAYDLFVHYRMRSDWAEKPGARGSLWGERNPVYIYASRLIERKDFGELFRVLKSPMGHMMHEMQKALREELLRTTSVEGFKTAVLPTCESAEDVIVLARIEAEYLGSQATAITVLEEARSRHRGDPNLHFELARRYAEEKEWKKAFDIARAGVLSASKGGPILERLVLYAARLGIPRGEKTLVSTLLAEGMKKSPPERFSHWAEIYFALGQMTEALPLYQRAQERGEAPNLYLAEIYLALGEYEDALRYSNRHQRSGSLTQFWAPEEEMIERFLPGPRTAAEIRTDVLAKLGEDYFVSRLLRNGAKPTEEDRSRVSQLLARLTSGTEEERIQARDDIIRLDPRVAPLLYDAVQTDDVWVKDLLREVLDSWAEPH